MNNSTCSTLICPVLLGFPADDTAQTKQEAALWQVIMLRDGYSSDDSGASAFIPMAASCWLHVSIWSLILTISPISAMQYRARTRRKNAVRAASRKARRAQMQRAEELFRRCLDMAPCDGRAYVGLGRILVDAQRYGEAVKLYEEGVRLTGMPPRSLTQSQCAQRRRRNHDARPVD